MCLYNGETDCFGMVFPGYTTTQRIRSSILNEEGLFYWTGYCSPSI